MILQCIGSLLSHAVPSYANTDNERYTDKLLLEIIRKYNCTYWYNRVCGLKAPHENDYGDITKHSSSYKNNVGSTSRTSVIVLTDGG